jgi:hypothetical protein
LDKLVFFHKTPALWNKSRNLSSDTGVTDLAKLKKEFQNLPLNTQMSEFFSTDVYFQMCKEICLQLGIKEFHIVHGYLDGELRNWTVQEEQGWCKIDSNTTYWSFTEPQNLLSFMDSSIIVSRGNYPIFHQWLSDHSVPHERRFWLHYPATSLRFPHLDLYIENTEKLLDSEVNSPKIERTLTGMLKEHELEFEKSSLKHRFSKLAQHFRNQRSSVIGGPYSMVLADGISNVKPLSDAFPNAMIQTFVKPALWNDNEVSYSREYDLMYCGTSLQSTKNHHCFVQLVKHLDTLVDHDLNVVIAGNKAESNVLEHLFQYPFLKIKLINVGEVTRSQLQSLFGKSKTMIVTSGRDANPRIIQESLVHGARVIAIDTLSDGLDFISSNPLLGTVLKSDSSEWKYARNGNLVFLPSIHLASRVVEEINKSSFPDLVMDISRRKLSLQNSVQPLINTIKSFR